MKFALVDCRISEEIFNNLLALGYDAIRLPMCDTLPPAMSAHPDMLLHYSEGRIITSRRYYEKNRALFDKIAAEAGVTLILSDAAQEPRYPRDAIFNALSLGNNILLREGSVAREILLMAKENGINIINTNQGYPACTTLLLDEGHIITADMGIANSLARIGIDVTVIENGDISLPPYEYGFIGGASGVDSGCVFFLGDIVTHRSYEIIKGKCSALGLRIISLGSGLLADFGGIVFIEKNT